MDKVLGASLEQWAILYGWYGKGYTTLKEAIWIKFKYRKAYDTLPDEECCLFGVERVKNYDAAQALFDAVWEKQDRIDGINRVGGTTSKYFIA